MDTTTQCTTCGQPCSTVFPRYISFASDSDDPNYICHDCWLEELSAEDDDECMACRGRGSTIAGWPCEECDGTGLSD